MILLAVSNWTTHLYPRRHFFFNVALLITPVIFTSIREAVKNKMIIIITEEKVGGGIGGEGGEGEEEELLQGCRGVITTFSTATPPQCIYIFVLFLRSVAV